MGYRAYTLSACVSMPISIPMPFGFDVEPNLAARRSFRVNEDRLSSLPLQLLGNHLANQLDQNTI